MNLCSQSLRVKKDKTIYTLAARKKCKLQVLQPLNFFKTLHTLNALPGWRRVYDFFRV